MGRRLKQLYANSADPKDDGLASLTWDYPAEGEQQEPSAEAVLKEMNGYTWSERRQLASFQELEDDRSTACGAWLYCGVYPKEQDNLARAPTRRARWAGDTFGLGLGMARQSAQHVQPRLS